MLKCYILIGMALIHFSAGAELEITKENLAKWVETRKLISLEKEQWVLEEEILKDRIELIASERDALNQKITDTQELITEADEKRSDLVEENDALKMASTALAEQIILLESKVMALLPRLPEPVQDRIKPLSQRIPTKADTDLSLSERYQNVIGVVNELNKGAGEITVISEVRTLENGNSAEVQTLYIGYARAYYCTNKGDIAGVGYPTDQGWVWESNDAIAQEVADSISILKNEKVAEFISLPLRVY